MGGWGRGEQGKETCIALSMRLNCTPRHSVAGSYTVYVVYEASNLSVGYELVMVWACSFGTRAR